MPRKSTKKKMSTGSKNKYKWYKNRRPLSWLSAGLIVLVVTFIGVKLTFFSHAAAVPIGLYSGPGAVSAHNSFSTWLGAPVPYATDYIDYKGGWSYDFTTNPSSWLYSNWGQWVKSVSGRRLVLGVPMLENGYAGQFSQEASGAFDQYFTSMGQQLVANGLNNTIIRLGYEANNPTIGPWQATDNPSGYIQAFRHVVGVLKSVSGSSFLFDWNPTAGLTPNKPLNSFASFYPGDDVVNIIGIDQYDIDWNKPGVTPQQRWNDFLTQTMGLNDHANFAAAHSKPLSFPEWGLYAPVSTLYAGGGDDPYYIDQMANWFTLHNTAYQSYFNLNWGGGTLSSFPNGQAEYKKVFGSGTSQSPSDTISPVVTISSPTNGSSYHSSVTVNASSTDNVNVTQMQLYLDSKQITMTSSSSLSNTINLKHTSSGNHTILVKAFDAAGNSGQTTTSFIKY